MIEKQVLFFGQTPAGVFAQALFSEGMSKTAGVPDPAWETAEEIRAFIKKVNPEDRKRFCYVLVNALGAGEAFGSNINADYFPWDALTHDGTDYGYKTFLNAHAFQHHANKDPARAFGEPVVSALNHHMRRVELVIRLDREKAKVEGADGIIARIDAGEFPDVSMGCKVPYDVCSICSHKSKTRNDYCIHMRPPEELRGIYGPNKILPDGRKIYVLNLHPRFFDISFVFIGADKTAKVMAKLAAKGDELCIGNVCALPENRTESIRLYDVRGELLDPGQLRKTASARVGDCDGLRGPCGRLCAECSDRDACHTAKLAAAFGVKQAAQKKQSEIEKRVPVDSFASQKLPVMEGAEPDISKKDLDSLAEKPLSGVLGSAIRAGIILKPHEFQHLVLRRMGEDSLLKKLDREHKVFKPSSDFSACDIDEPLDEVFELLKKYIKERTALGTPFQIRVMVAGRGSKNALPTRAPIGHSLLDKVSAAYNGYRRGVLEKIAQVVHEVRSDPRLVEEILGDGLSMIFKTASDELISTDSVKYLLGAHLQNRSLLTGSVAGAATIDDANLAEIHNPA